MSIDPETYQLYKKANTKLDKLSLTGVWKLGIAKKARIKDVKTLQRFLESNGYHQLLKQPLPRNMNELYRTASMAYAWMPTMLEFYPDQLKIPHKELIKLLGRLNRLDSTDERMLLENLAIFINHSLVGAVKTLHILNPQKYPLMDSRAIRGWNKLFPKNKGKSTRFRNLSSNLLFTVGDLPDEKRLAIVVNQYLQYRGYLKEWVSVLKTKDTVRDVEFKLYLAGYKV